MQGEGSPGKGLHVLQRCRAMVQINMQLSYTCRNVIPPQWVRSNPGGGGGCFLRKQRLIGVVCQVRGCSGRV